MICKDSEKSLIFDDKYKNIKNFIRKKEYQHQSTNSFINLQKKLSDEISDGNTRSGASMMRNLTNNSTNGLSRSPQKKGSVIPNPNISHSRNSIKSQYSFDKSFMRQSTEVKNTKMIRYKFRATEENEPVVEKFDNEVLNNINDEIFRIELRHPMSLKKINSQKNLNNSTLNNLSSLNSSQIIHTTANKLSKTKFKFNYSLNYRLNEDANGDVNTNGNRSAIDILNNKNLTPAKKSMKSMKLLNLENEIDSNISFELKSPNIKIPNFKKKESNKISSKETFHIPKSKKRKDPEKFSIFRENEISILKQKNKDCKNTEYQLNIYTDNCDINTNTNFLNPNKLLLASSISQSVASTNNANSISNNTINPQKTLTFNKHTLNFNNNLLIDIKDGQCDLYIEDLHFEFVRMNLKRKEVISNIERINVINHELDELNTLVFIDEVSLD